MNRRVEDYDILEELYSGPRSIVCRARKVTDGASVILKTTSRDQPTATDLGRLLHEYRMLNLFRSDHVIKPLSLEKFAKSKVLVIEDLQGISLSEYIHTEPFQLTERLVLAVEMARGLADIHRQNVVHKDIKPQNLLVTEKGKGLKFIDFDMATLFVEENTGVDDLDSFGGTLAYISPEQTGRMNRSLDYRSDYYSFGVALYELFTGRLPFEATDPLEVIHSHLAQLPRSPERLNVQVPRPLGAIVLKLLEKRPENRYQSAQGILRDLNLCLDSSRAGLTPEFVVGESDVPERFRLSERLYGREEEVKAVLKSFHGLSHMAQSGPVVSGSCALVLLVGPSGIGKTVLVREVQTPILQERGYFLTGKHDKLKRDVPFFGLVNALKDLVNKILALDEQDLEVKGRLLQEALGPNRGVLAEAFPEVTRLLGGANGLEPLEELAPRESQNRFFLVLRTFLSVFSADRPIVLFLDDLQWADSNTLQFLHFFLRDLENRGVLVIGTYRNNEIEEGHSLFTVIDQIRSENPNVLTIDLEPLSLPNLNALLSESLHRPPERTESLAKLILERTGGNPFYTTQFLNDLARNGHVAFDHQAGAWGWNEGTIRSGGHATDNLVELMTSRLERLSVDARESLKAASCLGTRFDLATLSEALEISSGQLLVWMLEAVEAGLVVPMGEAYQYVLGGESGAVDVSYRFLHDKIHQVAYSLQTPIQAREVHGKIGMSLWQKYSIRQVESDENLFATVNHLNMALELLASLKEKKRKELVDLNLKAAKRAKTTGAYEAASSFLDAAFLLLPENSWKEHYEATLLLHGEKAECAYLLNHDQEAQGYIDRALLKVSEPVEILWLSKIRCRILLKQGNQAATIDAGVEALSRVGLHLPSSTFVALFRFVLNFLMVQFRLFRRNETTFLAMPVREDPFWREVMDLFTEVGPALFQGRQNGYLLFAILVFSAVLKSGVHEGAATAVSAYSTILVAGFQNMEGAGKYGKVAVEMTRLFPYRLSEYWRISFIQVSFLEHFQSHWPKVLEMADTVATGARDAGDFVYAGYTLTTKIRVLWYAGFPLSEIEAVVASHHGFLTATENQASIVLIQPLRQLVLALMGKTQQGLSSSEFQEETYLADAVRQGSRINQASFFLFQMIFYYHVGEYERALEFGLKARSLASYLAGMLLQIESAVYFCLVVYALRTVNPTCYARHVGKATSHLKELKKLVRSCPANFLAPMLLVQAEASKAKGRRRQAEKFYDQALDAARKYDLRRFEALGSELLFRFWCDTGQEKLARYFFPELLSTMERWGATVLVERLKSRYVEWIPRALSVLEISRKTGTSTATPLTVSDGHFDFQTVIKGTHELSGEIKLGLLLPRLLNLVMENAGATRGVYLMRQKDVLRVFADGAVGTPTQVFLEQPPALEGYFLCESAIRFVNRTGSSLILNDVQKEGLFTQDQYILQQKPSSVLCLPILNKGVREGILYLENNLMPDAFTQERIQVLNVLATQAAISIENARLFDDLSFLVKANQKFVPKELFTSLGRGIVEVNLGDQIQREISILFSDIRSFTALSEKMTPQETFNFINSYLSRMGPIVRSNRGYVDKYIGDAIMALFPRSATDALRSAIEMRRELVVYNGHRKNRGYPPIQIGIGIHTGTAMLGIIGEAERHEATVIGDTVNLASRLEELTKFYGTDLVVSEQALERLDDPTLFHFRRLDRVQARGRQATVCVYEALDGLSPALLESAMETKADFEKAVTAREEGDAKTAVELFRKVLNRNPEDVPARFALERCLGV